MSLIIAALVLLTSCNGTGNTENEQTAESSSELLVPEQAIKASLTVAGEDIGKYTIVYARSELYEVGKHSPQSIISIS